MKRVFEHPPETLTGKRYWRSLGELSDTPEFRGWLEREFPAGAAQLEGDEWSRRGFLKLMGASMALAGFGLTSCRRPEAHLVPFTKSVEWAIPGKPLFYATAMPRRNGALPLVVTTHDGRPTKVDGNPLHPASGGASDLYAQASILDLYDPARSKRFINKGKASDRAGFEKYLTDLRTKIAADGGAGLAFLVEETRSPTRERLRQELEKNFPSMRWCVYDPLLSPAQGFSTQLSFGDNTTLVPQLERADVVFSLDNDFLSCGEGDLASVRAFTSRRRVAAAKDTMNRLYVVENRFTLTGAMADHRLRCAASQIPAVTHALAGKIAAATKDEGLFSVIATLKAPEGASFDDQWLTEAANDLIAKPGASLVLAGSHQPVVVQLLVYGINSALKNLGKTLIVREFARNPNANSILQLAAEMNAGRVKQLFIFGGDPIYNAPRALTIDPETKQTLDWIDLQKKVPEVVRLGYYEDATSSASQWHLPAAHYLESWGDALTADGAYLAIQPMILPLFGGLSEIEVMNMLLGGPKDRKVRSWCRKHFARPERPAISRRRGRNFCTTDSPRTFSCAINRRHSTATPRVALRTHFGRRLRRHTAQSPEIVLVGSYAVDDGRYANNGWLQEMPDPVTKLTWDNAALMSPAFAHGLKVENGDLIRVTVTEKATDQNNHPIKRELVIAAVDLARPRGQFGHDSVRLRPQTNGTGWRRCGIQRLSFAHTFESALHRRGWSGDR